MEFRALLPVSKARLQNPAGGQLRVKLHKAADGALLGLELRGVRFDPMGQLGRGWDVLQKAPRELIEEVLDGLRHLVEQGVNFLHVRG